VGSSEAVDPKEMMLSMSTKNLFFLFIMGVSLRNHVANSTVLIGALRSTQASPSPPAPVISAKYQKPVRIHNKR
jgi:hypothetical protein